MTRRIPENICCRHDFLWQKNHFLNLKEKKKKKRIKRILEINFCFVNVESRLKINSKKYFDSEGNLGKRKLLEEKSIVDYHINSLLK